MSIPSQRIMTAAEVLFAQANARAIDRRLQQTHVRVGDHDPEPRVVEWRPCSRCTDDRVMDCGSWRSCELGREHENWRPHPGAQAENIYRGVIGAPQSSPTRAQGGYGASFDER